MTAALTLLALAVAAKLAEVARYRHFDLARRCVADRQAAPLIRKSDHWMQLITMAGVWAEILLCFALGQWLPWPAAVPLVAIVVAGRLRALQEIGHTALHQGFGDDRELQWKIADWLGNFWTFKPSSRIRFQGHCVEHHPNASTDRDPNIHRLRGLGFVPGMSASRFALFVWHPLTPAGLRETLRLYRAAMGSGAEPLVRVLMQALALAACGWLLGAWACAAWLIALCLVYPLYSWWSLMAEHRWFAGSEHASRLLHDCEVTPRTRYRGLSGLLIRYLISPCTDSQHLAHHIYPRLHWRYLELADRHLMEHEPAYGRHTVTAIFGRGEQAIFPALKNRLVAR